MSTPAGYDTGHSLKIDVSWPTTAADFDLYVLDAAGNTVGTSASSADPEEVVIPPTTGTYTVRVVPFAPLGDSYTAKATLVTKPAPPPPGTATPPGVHDVRRARRRSPTRNNAGEPSIGTDWKTGVDPVPVVRCRPTRCSFDDSTSPATATWTGRLGQRGQRLPAGQHRRASTRSCSPTTRPAAPSSPSSPAQDSATCYTDDDGTTWNPSTGGGIPSGVDHQTIGGGAYSANGLGALPPSTYPHAVYYCSQDIATAFCAASHDGGTTFGPGVPTYSLLDCGGLHGHVKVAPDGTAYLPNKACGSNAGRGRLEGRRHVLDGAQGARQPARATPTRRSASAPTAPSTSGTSAPTASRAWR